MLMSTADQIVVCAGFVPLPDQPENNDIPVKTPPTGFDALRTLAVSGLKFPFARACVRV